MSSKYTGVTQAPFELHNLETGEVQEVYGANKKSDFYYNTWRLNTMLWSDGYAWVQEEVVKSALDIKIFNTFISSIKGENQAFFNQSKTAKKLNTSTQKLSTIIKRMKDIGFIRTTEIKGVFDVNPFIYIAPAVYVHDGKKKISQLQKIWYKKYGRIATIQEAKDRGSLIIVDDEELGSTSEPLGEDDSKQQ